MTLSRFIPCIVPVALVPGVAHVAPMLNEPTYESPDSLSRYVLGNGLLAVVVAYLAFGLFRAYGVRRESAAGWTVLVLLGGMTVGLSHCYFTTERTVNTYTGGRMRHDAVIFNYTLIMWVGAGLMALGMAYLAANLRPAPPLPDEDETVAGDTFPDGVVV